MTDIKNETIDFVEQIKYLESIIKYSPAMIYWKDKNSIYLGCNQNFIEIVGYENCNDIVGKTDYDLPWSNQATKFQFDDQEVIKSGAPKLNIEDIIFNKNGKKGYVITNKVPLYDKNQKIIGVLGIATDITDRKTIENELRASKATQTEYEMLKNIIKYSPDWIYWKDKDSVHLGSNEQFAKAAGLSSSEEMIGKTDYDLPWHERAQKYRLDDEEVIASGKPKINIEDTVLVCNQKEVVVISNKVPLRDAQGEIIGILGIATDITNQKNTEQALSKSKESAELALQALKQAQIEEKKQKKEAERLDLENTKNKAELKIAKITVEKEQEMRKTVMMLVGDIVHDLRTPMATIDSATDILSSISPGLHELVKEAYESKSKTLESINGAKLDYVINKMPSAQKEAINFMGQFINITLHELAVAQKYPEGDVAPEELSKCSIRRVLENTMEGYPRRKNLVINQCFSYDFIFMGNSILMLKMLFNLIKNADEQILANGKGEITITTKEAGDKNLLIIKDTAGGASPEIVENIFKEFFTTKKDGTGIGLAFCKKMMRNFGGDLTCHSVFGEYIEFTLSFPKTEDAQPYNVRS